jgi:hypothetical protein
MRCIKRYIAREIYHAVRPTRREILLKPLPQHESIWCRGRHDDFNDVCPKVAIVGRVYMAGVSRA